MDLFKLSEKEFTDVTLAAIMASFPKLGIDMSIAGRLSGQIMEEILAKDIKQFLKSEDNVKSVLEQLSKLTKKFSNTATYEYSNLTETGFDLEIKNCYFYRTREVLNTFRY